ncbi:putative bifunctional diguanylate cyclase/phosphodiesterase [Sphingomonas sp.]|uniref:putative bifunctional diguanylate cyclase/phosphodiesterase n=1 Tax=Sphingomonas sp. TaxID=28214 RepID=UPI003B00D40E
MRRDLVAGGVLIAAFMLMLFAGTHLIGEAAPDRTLIPGLLLDIALVLFAWRRYHDLVATMAAHDRAVERADQLSRTDELTGFLSRRAFVEEGAGLIKAALKRGRTAAMLIVDLDHFKTVNEVHGHLAGDAVLREASGVIRRALPGGAISARLDGDEFAVLVPFDVAGAGTVDTLADFIVDALARPLTVKGITAHIGASIGIARSEPDCTDVDALLRRAHIAMDAAKTAGRNRHIRFDATMERALIERNAIEAGLREGIPQGRFLPYYEQQIELETGRLIGFEVLARWDHPDGETIGPDSFIPIAEECGLISDLSVAVMRRAFVEARDWDASLTLSVNISPAQLKDPWLAQKIVKLLIETGFPASRLEIEITESSLFQNLSLAQSIVRSLKNQGIRIALDDFGTGYSSLAHLRALPFDRIKIDKSFVTAMVEDPEAAAIVMAISRLGDSLNLPITAEGIEDAAIRDRLKAIGCAKGQGWHYGKPMNIAAARRLLAERGLLPTARGPVDDMVMPEMRARKLG